MKSTGFELADSDTIFLDEIGELSLDLQAKLLRVLQDCEFERLGSSRTIRSDVPVVAATNRDLAAASRSGQFRQDLYYRLNVYPLTLPPLRERAEDIPLLAPGNIRELRNLIERAIITAQDDVLRIELPEIETPSAGHDGTLEEIERDYILRMLDKSGWRIQGQSGAAERLGLDPGTLRSRMRKLGIVRPF